MFQTQSTASSSKTERFIRGAGEVREDPEQRLWWPARVVVQMIQYLIAIIMVTIGEGMKAVFTGKTSHRKREREDKAS